MVWVNLLDRRATFAYAQVGNQTLKLDPRGNRVTMVYDAASRLVGHRYPDGRRHAFNYDALAQPLPGERQALRGGRVVHAADVPRPAE